MTTISIIILWFCCYLLLLFSKVVIIAQALASEKVGFKSTRHHYNPGASYLTPLCLNLLTYETGMSHGIISKIIIE